MNGSDYDFSNYSIADVIRAQAADPGQISTFSGDLGSFRARGGKIISYHGRKDDVSIYMTLNFVHLHHLTVFIVSDNPLCQCKGALQPRCQNDGSALIDYRRFLSSFPYSWYGALLGRAGRRPIWTDLKRGTIAHEYFIPKAG